jgi:hypothetical protein
MANWQDSRYTAHHHDHVRDYRKHEPRPGDRGFSPPSATELPARFESNATGALEVAILAQAVPLPQAAELIEQYARTCAAAARLDAVSETIEKCCEAIEAEGGQAIRRDVAAEVA